MKNVILAAAFFVVAIFFLPRSAISKAVPAGDADLNWDSHFGMPGVDGVVRAIVTSGQDVYVGGEFHRAGHTAAYGIARWNESERKWHSLGAGIPGVDGFVYAIAVRGDTVFVGGDFLTAGGRSAPGLAIYKVSTDTWYTWDEGVSGGFYGAYVSSICVAGSDVYVGGSFEAIGTSLANNIGRWNGEKFVRLGTGLDGAVNAIGVSGSRVYVGGLFAHAGGKLAAGIAIYDGNSWSALDLGLPKFSYDSVTSIAINKEKVYFGGRFDRSGARSGVICWNSDSGTIRLLPGIGIYVFSLALTGDTLLAGGSFGHCAALWYGDKWTRVPRNGFIADTIFAVAFSGDRIMLGGNFTGVRSDSIAGTNDSVNYRSFWIVSIERGDSIGRSLGDMANNRPSCIAVIGSDAYVGGIFNSAGGAASGNVAEWDGQSNSWAPLTARGLSPGARIVSLATDGKGLYAATADSVFFLDRGLQSWRVLDGRVGGIRVLAASGGKICAGGENGVALWEGSSWRTIASGKLAQVRSVAIDGERVYAGGTFDSIDGVAAHNVALFNSAATQWQALGAGVNGGVDALVASEDRMYAGGSFTAAGGAKAFAIAEWNQQSHEWSALGGGVNGVVQSIAINGSRLYAAGDFSTIEDSISASNIALWDGEGWSPLGSGCSGVVSGVAAASDGVYGIGGFETAGEVASWKMARWREPDLAVAENSSQSLYHDAASAVSIENIAPNPFGQSCSAEIFVNSESPVRLQVSIRDLLGRTITFLADKPFAAGTHRIDWDAQDAPSGIYFFCVSSNSGNHVRKLMIAR